MKVAFRNTSMRCLAIALFAWCSPVSADTLGYATSQNWVGYGSRMLDMSTSPPITLATADSPGSTEISYSDQGADLNAYALTAPYDLRGSISAFGDGNTYRVGGFFRDELFVQSQNGAPVDLELQFRVTGAWSRTDADPSGLLRMAWVYPNVGMGTFTLLDDGNAASFDSTSGADGNIDVTLSLLSSAGANEIASGTYLPFSITLYGDVRDASIDWANTAVLTEVNVYQEGVLLGASQYNIYSANATPQFEQFENRTPLTPIPEPATIALLGLGLFALGALRRR